MLRSITLIRRSFPHQPVFDTAVSHALLRRAGRGEIGETLRVSIPARMVAFGRQDIASDGYKEAAVAARQRGFAAIERLAGGRAAVFHPGTIAFAWTVPDMEARAGITTRFKEIADIVAGTLERLGIEAHIGQIPGEYCPGSYSVNARRQHKIMGVGQRVIRGAAHVGGVIVVNDSASVRKVLIPVYEALNVAWKPATAGSIADELGAPRDLERIADTFVEEFADRFTLREGLLDDETLAEAETLVPDHASP
ncbi:MAG: lipoate--protein ligase family protein [Acidimicrobiia bacterium]|nr:lipoate--protein ligase family protein [Acidimicrobiia bacterium]